MGSIFKFKRFEVNQAGCAMKINTDGVLLGAIAKQDHPLHILDIGTGTGVIALMLAQRYPNTKIDAVEIDESAATAAEVNCAASPFAERVTVYYTPFEKFKTETLYHLIVSNPPYFVNDLKSKEKRKEIARHADEDFFEVMLLKAAAMLHKEGSIWLILPVKQAEKVIINAVLQKLFPAQIIHVYSDISKPEFRQIICLTFLNTTTVHEHLYIYESEGIYTSTYKYLLRDFFLAF